MKHKPKSLLVLENEPESLSIARWGTTLTEKVEKKKLDIIKMGISSIDNIDKINMTTIKNLEFFRFLKGFGKGWGDPYQPIDLMIDAGHKKVFEVAISDNLPSINDLNKAIIKLNKEVDYLKSELKKIDENRIFLFPLPVKHTEEKETRLGKFSKWLKSNPEYIGKLIAYIDIDNGDSYKIIAVADTEDELYDKIEASDIDENTVIHFFDGSWVE